MTKLNENKDQMCILTLFLLIYLYLRIDPTYLFYLIYIQYALVLFIYFISKYTLVLFSYLVIYLHLCTHLFIHFI